MSLLSECLGLLPQASLVKHVLMADSLIGWKGVLRTCFFPDLVLFRVRGWDQLLEVCSGVAEERSPSRERKGKKWERGERVPSPFGGC